VLSPRIPPRSGTRARGGGDPVPARNLRDPFGVARAPSDTWMRQRQHPSGRGACRERGENREAARWPRGLAEYGYRRPRRGNPYARHPGRLNRGHRPAAAKNGVCPARGCLAPSPSRVSEKSNREFRAIRMRHERTDRSFAAGTHLVAKVLAVFAAS